MNETPFVSVVIPVLNDSDRLRTCLEALKDQTYPAYEVIVVDNGSDRSVEPVVAGFSRAKTCHESRRGSYAARNRGIALSKGEVIAFTDSDCIPAPDWIEKGVSRLRSTPGCGMVAGRIDIFYKNPDRPTAVELFETVIAFPQKDYIKYSQFGTTANLFTLRSVLDDIGLFNDELKSGGDFEWGQRVFKAGYKQVYADDVRISHPARHTIGELYKKITRVTSGLRDLKARGKKHFTLRDICILQPLHVIFRILRHKEITGVQKGRAVFIAIFVTIFKLWGLRPRGKVQGMRIVVLHSIPVWLRQTQAWMYIKVRCLPDEVESHIVCEKVKNLKQFPHPYIHCFSGGSQGPFIRLRQWWNMRLRQMGLRHYTGFTVSTAKKHRARILHSHFCNIGWADMAAAKQAGLKHIVTIHGVDITYLPEKDPVWRKRYVELFRHVDRVLCEGPHMGQCMVNLGCPEEKIQLHHLGVNLNDILFKPRKWSPDNPFRVLIAASFREKKGIPYALEALGRLKKEMPLEITIIGDAKYAVRARAEEQRIFATIEKFNLQPNIRLLGTLSQSDLIDEAYKHHVFLSPSVTASDGDIEGGMPITIIEMAASGMPVVSTTHCDIPYAVPHGLLTEERDVDGLVNHLKWLTANPGKWQPMLEAGRRHVEKEFDASVQGERLMEIYRTVLNE